MAGLFGVDPATLIQSPKPDGTDDIFKRREAELAPIEKEVTQSMEQIKATKAPEFRPLPEAKPPAIFDKDKMKVFIPAVILMTAVGALASRKHFAGAMTALAGFTHGYQKGREMEINHYWSEYQANMDAAIRTNQQMMQEYQLALTEARTNLEMGMMKWKMTAQKYGDEVAAREAQQKGYMGMVKMFMDYQKTLAYLDRQNAEISQGAARIGIAQKKLEQQTPKLTEGEKLQEKVKAYMEMTPEEKAAYAEMQKAGRSESLDDMINKSAVEIMGEETPPTKEENEAIKILRDAGLIK